ncbi:exodeoxyribonuclease VII large subunit [Lichenibacterium minor]|uniref:Exodeoxyribonuclease 7 large subunit n=1 Tax=Lichenibacterium minor TaxID=2316528 RepID=A0A4Q2U4H7_9HYPH|nr:exodeoxyribonuclease VII large subunit [Lichenibacterium minor]RYC31459.1 exodeoxyribonuclease VII large subunit [Lichenibacterium minor]
MASRPSARTSPRGRTAAPSIFDAPAAAPGEDGEDGGSRLSNTPEVSVSELSGALKRTVEERFGHVRVRGEVSNYRGPHSSGHAYFSLKDEGARIDAVVWRTSFSRMRVKPEEGMEVVATGKLTTFPGKSAYQIVIESLEPAGVGALMAMVEERRRRFAAEGLFDPSRKRALPFLPAVIGVVTSPTGAVIRDILHRITDRFPRRVLLWPVRVQGDGSAEEVARAIRGFDALLPGGRLPRPDVLIVARGGGSLEDLWGFNDEAVIRAAADCRIPLVSAVGHETDWTLLDHVADLRAPTPTGAAELCVPVRAELAVGLDRLGARHGAAMLRRVEGARDALRSTARALPSGADLLALPRQRLDRAATALPSALRRGADARRLTVARVGSRLAAQSPGARLARAAERLSGLDARLGRSAKVLSDRRRQRLDAVAARLGTALQGRAALARQANAASRQRLDALAARMGPAAALANDRRRERVARLAQLLGTLGYKSVLGRGYALVRDAAGQPLRSAAGVSPGARLGLEFADGTVAVEALGGPGGGGGAPPTAKSPKPRAATVRAAKAPVPRAAKGPVNQGNLF